MFKSDFLEFFSHVHPVTPLIIYPPVMGYLVYLAVVVRALPPGFCLVYGALGLLIWTFVEYTMHRFAFHYQPRSRWAKQLHFMAHGVHHDYSNDASRLVIPPSINVPLAVVFHGLFLVLFGRYAPAAFPGLLLGYFFYDMIHYARTTSR